jgi:uncharacterized protein YdaU (DUF1376 family)
MAALPYMKLFPADYLADTQHLTTEEHGAYLLLLMNYWQTGKPLDNRKGQLAKITKLSDERWAIVEQTLRPFFKIKRGIWKHERVDFDIQFVLAKSTKASFAGRVSGVKRANRRSTNVEQTLNHTDTDTDTDTDTLHVQLFEQFWKTFPRHEGSKAKAKEQYEKALQKVSHEELLGAVNRLVASKPDPKYIKHAERWLRDERWNDEIQPSGSIPANQATPVPKAFDPSEYARKGGVMPENIREALKAKGA